MLTSPYNIFQLVLQQQFNVNTSDTRDTYLKWVKLPLPEKQYYIEAHKLSIRTFAEILQKNQKT